MCQCWFCLMLITHIYTHTLRSDAHTVIRPVSRNNIANVCGKSSWQKCRKSFRRQTWQAPGTRTQRRPGSRTICKRQCHRGKNKKKPTHTHTATATTTTQTAKGATARAGAATAVAPQDAVVLMASPLHSSCEYKYPYSNLTPLLPSCTLL